MFNFILQSTTYTVTFEMNGHGEAPAAQTVESGKTAKKPADPTAEGYTFGGWYKDAALTKTFDFATPITADTTVYAKWTEQHPEETTVERLAGSNRTATAAEISHASFEKTKVALLASSLNYADALAGAPLAYAMNAPILLAGKKLDSATQEELERLGVEKIYILGGVAAVSDDIETQFEALGYQTERIAGDNRYQTAVKIAEKLDELTEGETKEAFFASAGNYPDALAISSVAAIKGAPVLYVAANGALKDTGDYLKNSDITFGTILGGEAAVGKAAVENLQNCGVRTVDRIGGDNRYDTCLKINEKYAKLFGGEELTVATGLNYPDALAGGVYAAVKKAPLLLVNNKKLSDEQKAFLASYAPTKVTAFGGESAVSDATLEAIVEAIK